MAKPKVRFWYDRCGTPMESFAPSRTKQQFVAECDINNILSRYRATGLMRQVPGATPLYGDFSALPDYHQALNAVVAADAAFMALPSEVRAQFGNDPGAFVDFAQDPANIDQMRKWGLAPKAAAVDSTPSGGAGGAPPAPTPPKGAEEAPGAAKSAV